MDIRNVKNKVNQGMERSFYYPYNEKYVVFTYVMRS